MISKKQKILNSNDSTGISLIILLYVGQYRDLDKGLLYELFGFFYNFDGHKFLRFMIKNF